MTERGEQPVVQCEVSADIRTAVMWAERGDGGTQECKSARTQERENARTREKLWGGKEGVNVG